MAKPALTKNDINKIFALDNEGSGDRAGAYVLLWQLTGSSEALMQARISSFSGGVGGTAFAANLELQKELGAQYPGLFKLSEKFFQQPVKDVSHDLDRINTGQDSINRTMFTGGREAWSDAGMKHNVPANRFAINPLSSNFADGLILSKGTKVALEGTGQAELYGKSPSDFIGKPGFSVQMVAGLDGEKLLTIKEDSSGKTVYVGDGGDEQQKLYDKLLIDDGNSHARDATSHAELARRHDLLSLRQHEEPGEISISKEGYITLLNAAKAQAAAQKKPLTPFQQQHAMLLQRAQGMRSVAPVRKRLGMAPLQKRRAAEAGAAEAMLATSASGGMPGSGLPFTSGLTGFAPTLRPAGAGQGAAALVRTRAMQGALPASIAPRGAAVSAAAVLAQARAAGGAAARLQAAQAAFVAEGQLAGQSQAQGNAVLRPAGRPGPEGQRAGLHNVVHGADGNDTLVPGDRPQAASVAQVFSHRPAKSSYAFEQDISDAFENIMFREARRPPSGVTGLDPRLTVPWPGVKLPG